MVIVSSEKGGDMLACSDCSVAVDRFRRFGLEKGESDEVYESRMAPSFVGRKRSWYDISILNCYLFWFSSLQI
jgi:hypothetical protein